MLILGLPLGVDYLLYYIKDLLKYILQSKFKVSASLIVGVPLFLLGIGASVTSAQANATNSLTSKGEDSFLHFLDRGLITSDDFDWSRFAILNYFRTGNARIM